MRLNRLVFLFSLFLLLHVYAFAQQINSFPHTSDSTKISDSTQFNDSLRSNDTIHIQDSSQPTPNIINAADSGLYKIFDYNKYVNSGGELIPFYQSIRNLRSNDFVFYSIALCVLLFAVLRFLYPRYFTNLFRVFFNTSLRQNQLTDQLLQAKLPSLFFNIFFIIAGGWYTYLLLNYFGKPGTYSNLLVILICSVSLFIIYLVKFSILKFAGWVTGYKQEADIYIFIIFLINKIIGITLIPFIIIIAFSDKNLVEITVMVSFIIIALMTIMRYFRAYSLLQNRLKISRFHFFLYISGIEIIPLFVIYKLALIFISNNL
jgi:hypothetical protein